MYVKLTEREVDAAAERWRNLSVKARYAIVYKQSRKSKLDWNHDAYIATTTIKNYYNKMIDTEVDFKLDGSVIWRDYSSPCSERWEIDAYGKHHSYAD